MIFFGQKFIGIFFNFEPTRTLNKESSNPQDYSPHLGASPQTLALYRKNKNKLIMQFAHLVLTEIEMKLFDLMDLTKNYGNTYIW